MLDFRDGRVPARIVGVRDAVSRLRAGQGEGFVVADEEQTPRSRSTGTCPGREGRPSSGSPLRPDEVRRVRSALRKSRPFSSLDLASRSASRTRALAADPLARGVTLTLEAAALVAVALAVLALWLALAGELGDERGELLDLEAQGVGPETLRRQFRVRAALFSSQPHSRAARRLGVLLSRLAVALVRLSAGGTTPEPLLCTSSRRGRST